MSPRGLEITSMADIPSGTGLGSSGSFTTCLLKVLHAHKRNLLYPRELAEMACHIQIDLLGEPIGKQDQYIAAYGGVTCSTSATMAPWPPGRSRSTRTSSLLGGQPDDGLHRLFPDGRPDL